MARTRGWREIKRGARTDSQARTPGRGADEQRERREDSRRRERNVNAARPQPAPLAETNPLPLALEPKDPGMHAPKRYCSPLALAPPSSSQRSTGPQTRDRCGRRGDVLPAPAPDSDSGWNALSLPLDLTTKLKGGKNVTNSNSHQGSVSDTTQN